MNWGSNLRFRKKRDRLTSAQSAVFNCLSAPISGRLLTYRNKCPPTVAGNTRLPAKARTLRSGRRKGPNAENPW